MTDLEMTKLCAEAMGYKIVYTVQADLPLCITTERGSGVYNPLKYDAEAMALVKKLHLDVEPCFAVGGEEGDWLVSTWNIHQVRVNRIHSADLNRAIVECVAKMQSAR